jgi:hypothetical protein
MEKKFGGRPLGAKGKISEAMRESLTNVLQCEIEGLKERFESLFDLQRIELLIKLLPYAVPKLATEIKITEQPPTRFDFDIDVVEKINDEIVVTNTYNVNNDEKIENWYNQNEQ